MAWTERELKYLEENREVFETEDLTTILTAIENSRVRDSLPRNMASKLAFYSAMALDPDSICIVVENRGDSRSSRRADAGQKIMRIHYGIENDKLSSSGDESSMIVTIPQRVSSPPRAVRMFEFTFFKGTLRPESLERLMLKPLIDLNVKIFGKPFKEQTEKIISKVDWSNI